MITRKHVLLYSIIAINMFLIFRILTCRISVSNIDIVSYMNKNVSIGTFETHSVGDFDETVLNESTLKILKNLTMCFDKDFDTRIIQHGDYCLLKNFVKAGHRHLHCHETVTYTAHADFTYLDNLVPLLLRWKNPVSIALYAPGDDFELTIKSIRYLRDCTESYLVKEYVTFHVYFDFDHVPAKILNMTQMLKIPFNCSAPIPYQTDPSKIYRFKHKLSYPINVGRNIARNAALTHYIFPSDIEIYPSPYLAERFLNMIARNGPALRTDTPKIFAIKHFEIEKDQKLPNSKGEIVKMVNDGVAVHFHAKICPLCHNFPNTTQWMNTKDTGIMDEFLKVKRAFQLKYWEPFYIGTQNDPLYDEKQTWEIQNDKISQGYILCVMDYDYVILNNAFLVHKPGIRLKISQSSITYEMKLKIRSQMKKVYEILYGKKHGCVY